MKRVVVGDAVNIGDPDQLTLIAGPCVLESEEVVLRIAHQAKTICARLGAGFVFKASFDKANRTSSMSYRGTSMATGLQLLKRVKEEVGVPVTTDIHESHQAEAVASVADLLQIPALLCRQTDLLVAAAQTGRPVNVKKGQFMAPSDMEYVIEKLEGAGAAGVLLTERGTFFGYNSLVVDFGSLVDMRKLGRPVIFDASHSVQLPTARGATSGGRADLIAPLARAAAGIGMDALFVETHPFPEAALSDAATTLPLNRLEELLETVLAIRRAADSSPREEDRNSGPKPGDDGGRAEQPARPKG